MKSVNLVICLAVIVTSCSFSLSEATKKTVGDIRAVVNPVIIRAVEDYSLTLARTEMYASDPTVSLKGVGKMIYKKKSETIEVLAYFHRIDKEDVQRNCSCKFTMWYFKQGLNMPDINPFKMTNYKCTNSDEIVKTISSTVSLFYKIRRILDV